MRQSKRVPGWMILIIVLVALPVIALPIVLSHSGEIAEGNKLYMWLYPAYVLATAILAYQCYGRRTEMTWILLALMLLTHAAIWVLAKGDCYL